RKRFDRHRGGTRPTTTSFSPRGPTGRPTHGRKPRRKLRRRKLRRGKWTRSGVPASRNRAYSGAVRHLIRGSCMGLFSALLSGALKPGGGHAHNIAPKIM